MELESVKTDITPQSRRIWGSLAFRWRMNALFLEMGRVVPAVGEKLYSILKAFIPRELGDDS